MLFSLALLNVLRADEESYVPTLEYTLQSWRQRVLTLLKPIMSVTYLKAITRQPININGAFNTWSAKINKLMFG